MTGRYPTKTVVEFTPTPSGFGPVVSKISNQMESGLPQGVFNDDLAEESLPYEQQGLPSSEVTIAEILKNMGYYTAHIGKWHLGRSPGKAPNDQGFDDSLLMASGLYLPEDNPNVVNARVPFDPIDQFLWARMNFSNAFNNSGRERFRPKDYLTDYWTDEAVKVIRNNKHRPFFIYLAHWGPHTPLQATREDFEAVGDIKPHRLRVYAAMVRAIDRSVGRITKPLKMRGSAIIRSWFSQATMEALAILAFRRLTHRSEDGSSPTLRAVSACLCSSSGRRRSRLGFARNPCCPH